MRLSDTRSGFGWISIAMHWLVALTVIALFGLGLWMTGLDYYHPWYRRGPDLHRGIGVLLALAVILRLALRWSMPRPEPAGRLSGVERRLSRTAHALLYLLPLLLAVSGYLISTADGRPLSVFDWFEIPALVSGIENQEDVAGDVHYVLGWALIGLAGLHALAALKHHFLDRDATLRRMLRPQA